MNHIMFTKLKQQCSALGTLKFSDKDDVRFIVWLHKTKFILVLLSSKKEEKYIREELITMLEECVRTIPAVPGFEQEINATKKELQDMLKFIIEILELREKALGDEEKQEAKKLNKKIK